MRAANFIPVVALSGLLFLGAGFPLAGQASGRKAQPVLAVTAHQSIWDLNPYVQATLLPVGLSLDSARGCAFSPFDRLNLSGIGQAQLPVNLWLRFALCNATQKDTLAVWFHLGEAECAIFINCAAVFFLKGKLVSRHLENTLKYGRISLITGLIWCRETPCMVTMP